MIPTPALSVGVLGLCFGNHLHELVLVIFLLADHSVAQAGDEPIDVHVVASVSNLRQAHDHVTLV
jgi:hypothetical protein